MKEAPSPAEQNVEYLRRLYENTLDWYKVADSKGQLILTLSGAITVFGVLGLLDDQPRTLSGPPLYVALSAMAVLCLAIYCAVEALHSNLTESSLRRLHQLADVGPGRVTSDSPQVLSWFGMISTLSRSEKAAHREALAESLTGQFVVDLMGVTRRVGDLVPSELRSRYRKPHRRLEASPPSTVDAGTPTDDLSSRSGDATVNERDYAIVVEDALQGIGITEERRAMAAEIVMLSSNVLQKHRWVNRGWTFCGLALVLALIATILDWIT